MDTYEVVMFLAYFISLLAGVGLAFIPASIAKKKGYSFGLWWFYRFMLFIVAIIHVNLIPDKTTQSIPVNAVAPNLYYAPSNSGQSAADELKKYKELLDSGTITQEEFDAKKRQILKL